MTQRRIALVSVSRADRAMTAVVGRALMQAGADVCAVAVEDAAGPDTALADWGVPSLMLDADLDEDDGGSAARRMGRLTSAFAGAFQDARPEIVVLTGDRYETLAAAGAASLSGAVLAHLHGGELTLGALDDRFRHAITKLSHLHFCAVEPAVRRLRGMGEESWRITLSGAPGVDLLRLSPGLERGELFQALEISDPGPFALACWHPETLSPDGGAAALEAFLAALDRLDMPVLFTGSNVDPGGRGQGARIAAWTEGRPRAWLRPSLGPLYAAALSHAALMAGNSSSGIIEAVSFALPAVDVGDRQAGRDRGENVLHAPADADAILAMLVQAASPAFRQGLEGMHNPYGDGHAGDRIAARLVQEPLDARLYRKAFPDEEPRP